MRTAARVDMSVDDILDAFDYGLVVYGGFAGLYPGYDAPANSSSFYFDDEEDALYMAEQVLTIFEALPDRIVAYRALVVDNADDIREPYGKHWSLDPDLARSVVEEEMGCGQFREQRPSMEQQQLYILEGAIPSNAVDWSETFAHWIVHSSELSAEAEEEIYVKDQDAVRLLDVEGPFEC